MHIQRVNELNMQNVKDFGKSVKNEFFPKHDKYGKMILSSVKKDNYDLVEQTIFNTNIEDHRIFNTGECTLNVYALNTKGFGEEIKGNILKVVIMKDVATHHSPALSISVNDTKLDVSQRIISNILRKVKSDLDPESIRRKNMDSQEDEISGMFKGFEISGQGSSHGTDMLP